MEAMNDGIMPVDQGTIYRHSMQQDSPGKTSSGTDWLKFFSGGGGGQKKVTRDGQPAKRRGPKPDSRPALTRRQELNRQAQRTHRERKEQYMRSLETEVSRLREAYTQEISAANLTVHQHREMVRSLSEENNILKDILASQGINVEAEVERRKAERASPTFPQHHQQPLTSPFASSSVSSQPPNVAQPGSNLYTTPPATVTPPTTVSVSSSVSPGMNGVSHVDVSPTQELTPHNHSHYNAPCDALATLDRIAPASRQPAHPNGIFETDPQLQIDFILKLEGPCREHTDYLCRRSVTEADDEDMPFSGHALMATCPPPSYISNTTPEQTYPHQTYDLPHANLSTLLNLSRQLVTEGQITPIMALQCLKSHELYRSLTRDDIKIIMETLNTKVRCYGFGAVVEDFELKDCLSSVVGTKVDLGISQVHDDMLYS
ncbi:protein flbB [Aspergillus melleus]|uniref:protein flbB n=1 Tax=Aspergillus melleus TaxID=138277 RepID=UPI001E8DF650|nr:uncharacterized protein LDX57_007389 [Aspergillus melleus]KAH8429718.1 hypothetical protein LDX57_007389 [Aspergillus melleus]